MKIICPQSRSDGTPCGTELKQTGIVKPQGSRVSFMGYICTRDKYVTCRSLEAEKNAIRANGGRA